MTGESSEYDDNQATMVADAAAEANIDDDLSEWITIRAKIEWSGDYNPKPMRTTTLGPFTDLGAVRDAVRAYTAAKATATRASKARPPAGWSSQIRELTRTRAGYAAAERAGLNVTERTLLGWLSGEVTPSAANLARIEKAAIGLQYERSAGARSRATEAAHRVADALSDECRELYGAEVRFFDIKFLHFE